MAVVYNEFLSVQPGFRVASVGALSARLRRARNGIVTSKKSRFTTKDVSHERARRLQGAPPMILLLLCTFAALPCNPI